MWDPGQYLRFADERARPFRDLVAALGDLEPRTVADLGCGPGGLTASLLDRWPGARIWGVDRSSQMIDHAARRAVPGRLDFVAADVVEWRAPHPLDLILSNACFHWVPDHRALLDHLLSQLTDRGIIAFQVPNNFTEPSHVLLGRLAESDRWAHRLADVSRPAVEEPGWYVNELSSRGLVVNAWETTYFHLLDSPRAIVEWLEGTTLRPVLALLDSEERRCFLAEYGDLVAEAYTQHSFGTIFPFRRIFVIARRG